MCYRLTRLMIRPWNSGNTVNKVDGTRRPLAIFIRSVERLEEVPTPVKGLRKWRKVERIRNTR